MKVKSPSPLFNSVVQSMALSGGALQTAAAVLRGMMAIILFPRRLLLFAALIYAICIGTGSAWAQSPCTNPVAVRPILFVPGINESSNAWGSESLWTTPGSQGIRDYVMSDLEQQSGYTNPYNYDLYFDGTNVRLSMNQAASSSDPIASNLNIPCNARFFSIRFFGWNGLST